jgi:hypothetical protein
MSDVNIDRRAFIAKLGGAAAVAAMAPEALAEELEHEMIDMLGQDQQPPAQAPSGQQTRLPPFQEVYKGIGHVFDKRRGEELKPLPKQPTLVDFFERRFSRATHRHCLQSAHHALKTGQPELTIMSCLIHDIVLNLAKPDHGWWGAQMIEPYVDEKITWGIRYHQALRFYPDDSVGYEYPELYNRIFGKDYVPEPYIEDAYQYARKHKWYMEARLITLNDTYGFNKDMDVSLDPFIDIIGRHFKQPKEGLGYDNSPSAHMWRTMINPDRSL